MPDLERFIADCRAAHAADSSHKAVREVVARFLRHGDRVRCEVEGLGAIENVVREQ